MVDPSERWAVCECSGVERVLPSYDGACLSNLTPALLGSPEVWPEWIPDVARDASQIVLLVVDALGWEQLGERARSAPTMAHMEGGPITSVTPTTTSAALTSIATGRPPGEHGVVGYRISVQGETLNSLRWTTGSGDARRSIDPATFQPYSVFDDQAPPVITKGEFQRTGFTTAHLRTGRFVGYRTISGIAVEVERELRAGEPFVYAYYDGIDRIAHEYGFGAHYDAELRLVDRLVDDLLAALPRGAVLLVTADHGQIDCTGSATPLAKEISDRILRQSGEARFRWLHVRDGDTEHVAQLAREAHGDQAWVHTIDEVLAEGWFGPTVEAEPRQRLGDVAVVAKANHVFIDPKDNVPIELKGRHGSFTSAEMYVPLLAGWR